MTLDRVDKSARRARRGNQVEPAAGRHLPDARQAPPAQPRSDWNRESRTAASRRADRRRAPVEWRPPWNRRTTSYEYSLDAVQARKVWRRKGLRSGYKEGATSARGTNRLESIYAHAPSCFASPPHERWPRRADGAAGTTDTTAATAAAGNNAAAGHFQGRDQLRRDRRPGDRRAGEHGPRPAEGRLPGSRRWQAANAHRVRARRPPGRARRRRRSTAGRRSSRTCNRTSASSTAAST